MIRFGEKEAIIITSIYNAKEPKHKPIDIQQLQRENSNEKNFPAKVHQTNRMYSWIWMEKR